MDKLMKWMIKICKGFEDFSLSLCEFHSALPKMIYYICLPIYVAIGLVTLLVMLSVVLICTSFLAICALIETTMFKIQLNRMIKKASKKLKKVNINLEDELKKDE